MLEKAPETKNYLPMQRICRAMVFASSSSPNIFLMSRLSLKQLALLSAFLFAFGSFLTAQEYSYNFKSSGFSQTNPCKVFIGVGTSNVSEGLKVDYTVNNTPATQYGVLAGDIILTLDGVPVRSQSELLRERDKHQQGDAFTLAILRDGVPKTINARFKACSEEEQAAAEKEMENAMVEKEIRMEEMQALMQERFKKIEMGQRPILGVYENTEVNEQGLVISSVVSGKGAEAAGLKGGDVVVKVDGKPITGTVTLRGALENHKPGDQVSVVYLRDGKSMQANVVLSTDGYSFSHKVERDPCKVFIGVYTSGNALEGRGLRVNGVIDGTPAKESGVQPGDVILEFNGQAVNNHQELTGRRDDQKPGDAFTLTVLRDGKTMEIDARFKSCDTPTPVEETVQVLEESPATEERKAPQDIATEILDAYPSPTFGPVNIRFEAQAVPTTVRILDITGKEVFRRELPQFGGSYNEQVNLSNQKAGNYVLSVQQGDKVQSKQIVLLPRA